MNSVDSVIQGNESSLFDRVYEELEKCNASKKTLADYESHRNDPLEELIEISYALLLELGCWGIQKK
jgi:hypothetical protein